MVWRDLVHIELRDTWPLGKSSWRNLVSAGIDGLLMSVETPVFHEDA